MEERYTRIKELYTNAKQGHVFAFWNDLDEDERKEFLTQLEAFDPNEVNRVYTLAKSSANSSDSADIKPFVDTFDAYGEQRTQWLQAGLEAIRDGKVAALLLAGGQGTRLGYAHPKGMYDLGLPSHKSLFQIQAERLICARRLSGASTDRSIPYYVMTSDATHEETVQFFEKNAYFGLNRSDVFFFKQGTFPCLTPNGKMMLASKCALAVAPDGNGGVYPALSKSGALDDMEKRGVELVCQTGVDNCLVKPVDPVFVGMQLQQRADCATKAICKAHPHERVGVICLRNGKAGVVEYSEISEAMATATDDSGRLLYRSSHVCINSFTVKFLRRVVSSVMRELPYAAVILHHIAKKAIPYLDESGELVTPNEFGVFEAPRDEEFAPLKNASGAASDSPETCLAAAVALSRKYVEKAGGVLEVSGTALVEVSPLLSLMGEGLEERVRGKHFADEPVVIE